MDFFPAYFAPYIALCPRKATAFLRYGTRITQNQRKNFISFLISD